MSSSTKLDIGLRTAKKLPLKLLIESTKYLPSTKPSSNETELDNPREYASINHIWDLGR